MYHWQSWDTADAAQFVDRYRSSDIPFYNNHYSLPNFVAYIYQQVDNRIEQICVRHLIES